jgi:cytochrome P450
MGRNLAALEMNKMLPQILRRYRFRLVHPEAIIKHHSTFFVVQSGLEVYIEKRTENKV